MLYNKLVAIILGLITIAVLVFGVSQFISYQSTNSISCGDDWSYKVLCPTGTICKSIGQGPLAGGTCQPYLAPIFDLFFSKWPVIAPKSTNGSNKNSNDCYEVPANVICMPGYHGCFVAGSCKLDCCKDDGTEKDKPNVYGEEKQATVTVQDGSYYGPPYDPNLFQLEIGPSNNLFAKSDNIDLKQYLGKRITVSYQEVLGTVMGEQQLVIVTSIK